MHIEFIGGNNMIKIVGLGAGDIGQISFGAKEALSSGLDIYLRTENHPIIEKLDISYTSFDSYYDENDTFEQVYFEIAKEVIRVGKEKDIVYAVPGHPRVAEMTVSFIEDLSKKEGVDIEVIPSMSFLDAMYDFVGFDPVDGFKLIDAFQIERKDLDSGSNIIITQVCDDLIASSVKLKLMEYYEDDIEVTIVKAAGVKGLEEKKSVLLYELDSKENTFDNLTSIFVKRGCKKRYSDFYELVDEIKILQADVDIEEIDDQYSIINKNILEGSKKLSQTIDDDDIDGIISSSADILEGIVKIGLVGENQGYFDIWEIIDISKKK